MLGSRSTHLRSGLGGPAGRALQKWDRLMVGKAGKRLGSLEGQSLPDFLRPSYSTAPTLRVIPGPQAECFPPETFRLLAEQPYRITADSDRMGYRLQGQALPLATPRISSPTRSPVGRSRFRPISNRFCSWRTANRPADTQSWPRWPASTARSPHKSFPAIISPLLSSGPTKPSSLRARPMRSWTDCFPLTTHRAASHGSK